MRKNPSSLAAVLLALAGCETLVPYDSEFACAQSHDFGKCMDVQTAYDDARANASTEPAPTQQPGGQYRPGQLPRTLPKGPVERRGALVRETLLTEDPATRLRDARYRELAGLIENPVTPLVQAPRVLRTLIVSYSAGDALYMPRYVYYFAEEAKFVLGEYLQEPGADRTLYPSGPLVQR